MNEPAIIEYFELPELPGRKFFACGPLRATIATDVCAGNWRASNEAGTGGRLHCRRCLIGAQHAGQADSSLSPLHGVRVCARCHRLAPRLIFKHLCVSCQNREYEVLKRRNSKGTVPIKHAPLHRRTIEYLAAGQWRSRTIERTVDMDEMIVAVLRDEPRTVRFAFRAPARVRSLIDGIDDGTEQAVQQKL